MRNHSRRLPVWLLAVLVGGPLAMFGLVAAPAAGADPPSPIKHVVVLDMENHSFDSVLGFWCDENPGRCPVGGLPPTVTLSNDVTLEPQVEPDTVPEVGRSVADQERAVANLWNWNEGCGQARHYACIGGWTAAQQPNTTALADSFAISDDTFSTTESPPWGAHLYAVTGQTDGFTGENPGAAAGVPAGSGWGCNSDKVSAWGPTVNAPYTEPIPSCIPDSNLNPLEFPFAGAFEATPAQNAKTIMDSLEAAGLSWKIFGDPEPLNASGKETAGYIWDTCPSFAQCLDTSQHENNVQSSTFISEAESGNLPNFSLVIPAGSTYDDAEVHGSSMTAGDDWIGEIAHAVMSGPEWKSTALFITWDECGCFYDQVRPGVNPDGTLQGPRVPLIIVSPYAKPGFTDNRHATYDSILAYVEHDFGLPPLGVNDARAYDFSDAFDYHQKPVTVPALKLAQRK